ncbi:sulfotransferase [Pontixanthobacter aestiaquae]|uniref:Sulfotransferase domain-containing protein n=1 Tax=Pontixanthobacter aestiaquae TaxID=1509367 RepID=A0A844Z779_9SPHN|nr:sulfotransferase [Pontixanthobacter aestiaquae]MDN3645900.1 sulfotransferase [Pontixanthobacter aestiaquae]MXO83106.1 hypothetical protein [Pontixanthobacter aestiaquae]
MTGRYPNLFLAGAPKCGTTSLYDWLAQHPAIFGSEVKEPIFFRKGLSMGGELPERDYLSFYDGWKSEKYALDGSTHHFYSPSAAAEIKAAAPDAKIIIALRNPAEATHSMYHQLRYTGVETVLTLEESLAAENARFQTLEPRRRGIPENLLYSRVYAFEHNVSRYIEAFGRENVHIILLDDLKDHPMQSLRDIYDWLGIDSSCAENTDFQAKNGPKAVRSRFILNLAYYPPAWLGRFTKPLFSAATRRRIRGYLKKMSTTSSKNAPLDRETRQLLLNRHRSDIEWVERLLERDLSHWKQPAPDKPANCLQGHPEIQYGQADA